MTMNREADNPCKTLAFTSLMELIRDLQSSAIQPYIVIVLFDTGG